MGHASWCDIYDDAECDCGGIGPDDEPDFLEGHDPTCEGHANGAHLCSCGYQEEKTVEEKYEICMLTVDSALECLENGEYRDAETILQELKNGTPNS